MDELKEIPKLLGDELSRRGVKYNVSRYEKGNAEPIMLSVMLDHSSIIASVAAERLASVVQGHVKSKVEFVTGVLTPIPNAATSWVTEDSIPIRYTEAYDVFTDKTLRRLDTAITIREIDHGNRH